MPLGLPAPPVLTVGPGGAGAYSKTVAKAPWTMNPTSS